MTTATNKVWTRDCESAEWAAFIEAMHSGEQFECDQDMYYYWLEVLPPVWMRGTVKWPDGQIAFNTFGFAEGAEPITAFWQIGDRYFGRRTTQIARGY